MKARRITLLAALILGTVSVFCFTNPAAAQTTYAWDPNQTGSGSDGSGNWDSVTGDWASSGSTLAWVDGGNAVIGYGTGAAGTITIGSQVAPNSITFNPAASGNYAISGGSINLPNASMSITANTNATISSALVGSGGLTKSGNGTLTLAGTNTYTGPTVISSGTLQLTSGVPAGYVGYYNFSGGTANNAVSGGSAYNGALFGAAAIASSGGLNGGPCLSLPSGNESGLDLGVNGVPISSGNFTFSLWFYGLYDNSGYRSIFQPRPRRIEHVYPRFPG